MGGQSSLQTVVHFRFGTREIQATGATSDHAHSNVLRLGIHKTLTGRIIQILIRVMSKATEDWKEEFDHEVVAYSRLRPIQGLTIPKLYGTIQYAKTRALILSDIGGSSLSTPDGAVLDEQDIEPLLHQALISLNEYGVCHVDTKLDNFHLVADEGKDKIMIVDLESADFDQTEEELAYTAKNKTKSLLHGRFEDEKMSIPGRGKNPLLDQPSIYDNSFKLVQNLD
ncbi:hypothetical protein NOF04DRAFT_1347392 [Fusarium oxysporum II5]|nr:hypothetical protein NOF04DRAFT_1347392 [Fusarium oxysporum II5]